MKYIIDVSKDRVSKNGKLQLLCEIENSLPQYIHTAIDAEPYTEPDRKAIEDEVWEFVRFIYQEMDTFGRMSCFQLEHAIDIIGVMTYQEAKAKYEAWLKQKDEIHVGDEVTFEMAFGNCLDNNMKAVALDQAATGEEWCVLTENGCIETHDEEDLCKTGRHFDEVEELLKKIRGE